MMEAKKWKAKSKKARTFSKRYAIDAWKCVTKQAVHKQGNATCENKRSKPLSVQIESMQGKHRKRSKLGNQQAVGNG